MQCIEDTREFSAVHELQLNGIGIVVTYKPAAAAYPSPTCLWTRTPPTPIIFIVYAFVIPTLACFGLCANAINAIVFMRPKMTPSAFTYLAALSWLDCASCSLIALTGLSRSIFYTSTSWLVFDFQWQTPLFGITTGAANLILACVSCDRLVYLWRGVPTARGTPRFCRRKVARRMIFIVILISFIVNLPYFFVFVVNDDGTFRTTKFYYSHFYMIHNWFSFSLLAILPAIFLLIGNAAIIIAFRRWTKQSKRCQKHCNRNSKTTHKRYQHQMKLTITILVVITLYLVGELPAHFTSRKSVLNLLFGGDISKVNFQLMERVEIICISLNALQLSLNLIVYAVINPSFMPEFFVCLRGASDGCFKLFGFTAIANCWRRSCRQRGNSSEQCDRENSSHSAREKSERIGDGQSSVDGDDCDGDTWGDYDDDDDNDDDVSTPEMAMERYRAWRNNESLDRLDHPPLPYEQTTKRSSSLGAFAYDNPALDAETRSVLEKRKRHSFVM